MKKENGLSDGKLLEAIREELWPGGDEEHEWTQDTIEEIALLMTVNGEGPGKGKS